MSGIYVPTRSPEDWRRLLGSPQKHWRKGHSAMACTYSWERANGLPPEINGALGGSVELLLAIPEHCVPIPGKGGDSQCDVFALVRRNDAVIAMSVEAKVAEPFDLTVAEWLGRADGERSRQNRVARLNALLNLVGVSQDSDAGHLRYQLIHRAAAAVIEAQRFGASEAAMVVQSFSPANIWMEDFVAFVAHLGATDGGGNYRASAANGMPLALAWVSSPMPAEAAA